MNQKDREAWAAWAGDYHETCDKADRLAAMGDLSRALKLWASFYGRWEGR